MHKKISLCVECVQKTAKITEISIQLENVAYYESVCLNRWN